VRKRLSKDLTLYFDKHYPYLNPKKSNKKHTVILGIGGNIPSVRRRFEKLFYYLQKNNLVDIIETSPILKNPPFGYLNQDDFFNAIITIKTNLNPDKILRFALRTEHIFKRKRAFKNSPRTLDIDILFFDKIAINKRHLVIPHPKYHQRESVLIPLSYLKRRLL